MKIMVNKGRSTLKCNLEVMRETVDEGFFHVLFNQRYKNYYYLLNVSINEIDLLRKLSSGLKRLD